ncbi:MAG: chloride channel protein [Vicinamibacterales bacterium]
MRDGLSAVPRSKHLASEPLHPLPPLVFGGLAVLLGIVAGLGAYGFRVLIAVCHNLAFLGTFSATYDTNLHTPAAPWGGVVAFVPAAGAVIVVFLVQTFAPEAKGHGVPEVMDAIYYNKSIIRPVVGAIKALASAISIGTGGSVGREGPIIKIGAAFASFSGRAAGVSRWQRATLVAAGGGAGIAATFNTPIGGVLFAVEVLLNEVSSRTLVPVALATTTATYVARFLFGNTPAFPVPAFRVPEQLSLLPAYVCLGGITAVASIVFIRALYGADDAFEAWIPRRPYVRHIVGMLGVGAAFTMLFHWTGHYYVEGVGYATILDVLNGSLTAVGFLLLLCGIKLAVTSITLGSGASGGIFSPSLYIGATLGAAYGTGLHLAFPAWDIHPAVFALAGMAGVVAGATGAALTAIVMMFEMTLNYAVILPMTLTVAVSYGLRRLILPESIYTMKLVRRGHVMPEALLANAHMVHHVGDISCQAAAVLPADAPIDALQLDERADAPVIFVIVGDDRVVGVVSRAWAFEHASRLRQARSVADVARQDYIVVTPETTMFDLIAAIARARASVAVVVAPRPGGANSPGGPEIKGVVTKSDIAEALAEGMELFED